MNVFKGFIVSILAFLALVLVDSTSVHARNLSSRLGVGFVNQFSNSTTNRQVPAVSAKYGLSRDLQVSGFFGVNTNDPSGITLGAKGYKILFFENSLNFYLAGGAAYLKHGKPGLELLALFGAEFFIPGLDSLGLSFESGISLSNITGSFAVKTVGFTFLHAGMHFYF